MHDFRTRGYERSTQDIDSSPGLPLDHLPHLCIAPDLAQLAAARRFIAPEVATGDSEFDVLYLIAATELITNAIEAHQRADTDEPVMIAIDRGERALLVADQGQGYRPEDRPTTDHLAAGGRGLRIAESISPGLSWRPNDPQGTVFVLPLPTS